MHSKQFVNGFHLEMANKCIPLLILRCFGNKLYMYDNGTVSFHWMQWADDEIYNNNSSSSSSTKNDNKITKLFHSQEISRRNTHILYGTYENESNKEKNLKKCATHLWLLCIMRQVASVKHCTFCELPILLFMYYNFFFVQLYVQPIKVHFVFRYSWS